MLPPVADQSIRISPAGSFARLNGFSIGALVGTAFSKWRVRWTGTALKETGSR
jgi:hypothetical protein